MMNYDEEEVRYYDDDIYMDRRHAVAMEGLENELENQEENFEEFMNNMDEHLNFGPLERQNGMVPEEFVDAELGAFNDEEYQRACDPNCSWESIRGNDRWTNEVLGGVQWQFPSDMMKDNEIKFVRVKYELEDGANDIRIKNQIRGLFYTCASCDCCERHKRNFPDEGEVVLNVNGRALGQLEDAVNGQGHGKENNCICACRHIARRIASCM